ncbi:MAG: hypothetical protein K2M86_01195, partial [Odoribacter sp.]|nr:hypothetical protein [Odoribacter sp.]
MYKRLSIFGTGSWSGTYEGNLDAHGPAFHASSELPHLQVNKETIQDIAVDMVLENGQLDLLAPVDDPLLEGGCALSYDMSDSLSFCSVKGELDLPDLGALGFGLVGGPEAASMGFDMVNAGFADRSFFNLTLKDLRYANRNGAFAIDNLCVEDSRFQDYNTTTLKSDVFDVSMEGNFWNIHPALFVWGLVQNYLPAYFVNEKKSPAQKNLDLTQFNFEYAVQLKDANRVLRVLYPGLSISPGSRIASFFRRGDDKLNLVMHVDTIRYNDLMLQNWKVNMSGDQEHLKLDCWADKVGYGPRYHLFNLRNELTLEDNQVNNRLCWCNWESSTYSGELAASMVFKLDENHSYMTEIKVHPGVIVMNDSVWRVDSSTIVLQGKELTVDDFRVHHGNGFLSVRGKISEDPQERLLVNLKNFDIEDPARIAWNKRLGLFGVTTGSLSLQDYYNDFILLTDFYVKDWGIEGDTLGSAHFRSYWDTETKSLIVGAENRVGRETPLRVNGYYNPSTDSLDVNVRLDKVGLERLRTYASDMLSEVDGYLSGNVSVSGVARQPDISGFVYLDSVGLKINALNTKFFVHDSIRIDRSRFLFRNFLLTDVNGSQAILNGEYQVFDNLYKLNAQFDRFLVLNTGFSDNEVFY